MRTFATILIMVSVFYMVEQQTGGTIKPLYGPWYSANECYDRIKLQKKKKRRKAHDRYYCMKTNWHPELPHLPWKD